MKLVDILARELKVWPEGVAKLTQSFAGMVFYQDSAQQIVPLGRMEISDDLRDEYVTRAEWQSAVDALNAPKVVEWDGAGRPPEGTVCGLWYKGFDQGECTVLFMGAEVGVFKSHAFDHEQHGDLVHYSFYKVENSIEEKDAQERKKSIAEMTAIAGGQYSPRDSIVQRLYDAGYRKQVEK